MFFAFFGHVFRVFYIFRVFQTCFSRFSVHFCTFWGKTWVKKTWKNHDLRFIRTWQHPIRSFHQFFVSISPSPMKNPVPPNFKKITKNYDFLSIFVISFFHQPDFLLGNFDDFRKNRQKKVIFLRFRPRRHLFQFFFRVSCIIPIGDILRVRVFISKNDPFFNFCPFLTTPPRRHSNFTSYL